LIAGDESIAFLPGSFGLMDIMECLLQFAAIIIGSTNVLKTLEEPQLRKFNKNLDSNGEV
jgi:hypothetical protein